MKLLTGKVNRVVFDKKGETLMEAIVSILLLSILLVVVTTMIQTSRNVTANSMQRARELQEEQLNLVASNSNEIEDDDLVDRFLFFTGTVITVPSAPVSPPLFTASHGICLYDNDNIVAFFP
jgi:Tfp pilus assembly protein PilV